jgi:hypothetical protein
VVWGAKSECPAVKELVEALKIAVPVLTADSKKIGTVRNDGSRHTAGLAVEIMLDSTDLAEKAVADAIIDAVIKVHAQMPLVRSDIHGLELQWDALPLSHPRHAAIWRPKRHAEEKPDLREAGQKA